MPAKKSHLFILDPLDRLNLAWDTSIKLAFLLERENCDVYFCTSKDLLQSLHPSSMGTYAAPMKFGERPQDLVLASPKFLELTELSAIHMRREPPFDFEYITALWFLDRVSPHVPVFNDPKALLSINEKLVILDFPLFTKPVLVSSNPEALYQFAVEKCNANIVVKPLGLYGGRGVEHIEGIKGLEEKLHLATMNGRETRLIQEFNPAVFEGEVRCFTAGGKPVSWCLKVPKSGDFLANTRAGSVLKSYQPTEREIDVATGVGETLLKRGIQFAGLDIIGGWLSEVNITCPAMLAPDRSSLENFDALVKVVQAGTK